MKENRVGANVCKGRHKAEQDIIELTTIPLTEMRMQTSTKTAVTCLRSHDAASQKWHLDCLWGGLFRQQMSVKADYCDSLTYLVIV